MVLVIFQEKFSDGPASIYKMYRVGDDVCMGHYGDKPGHGVRVFKIVYFVLTINSFEKQLSVILVSWAEH